MFGAQCGKVFRVNVVANQLIIQVCPPIDVHGTWYVTGIVKQDVLVALDDPQGGVIEMLGQPGGADEGLGMGVRGGCVFHALISTGFACHARATLHSAGLE